MECEKRGLVENVGEPQTLRQKQGPLHGERESHEIQVGVP